MRLRQCPVLTVVSYSFQRGYSLSYEIIIYVLNLLVGMVNKLLSNHFQHLSFWFSYLDANPSIHIRLRYRIGHTTFMSSSVV